MKTISPAARKRLEMQGFVEMNFYLIDNDIFDILLLLFGCEKSLGDLRGAWLITESPIPKKNLWSNCSDQVKFTFT
jgi:hypothetical protein